MPNCLLCGSGVWYVGLFNADCTNARCTNFREPPRKEAAEPEYGSWAWADKLQTEGWRLEYREPARFLSWYSLDSTLARTTVSNDKNEYEFRLRQRLYAPKSDYDHGTKAWADDVVSKGCRVRQRGEEYEVIP